MKILLLDIETAPNTAHVWGLFKQNVSINQLMESSYVLCWAAKWYKSKEVMFNSVYKTSPQEMLLEIHALLDEADAVIHYNGTKFDIPTLNKEFLLHGLPPPAPYKQIDLLKTARNQFKFPSNKLDYVAKALGFDGKVKHIGHELWINCMAGNKQSWKDMEEYNKHDVVLLEKVYKELLPWVKSHANYSLYNDKSNCCPHCGSTKYHRRGFAYTSVGKYQRFQCNKCNTWFRGLTSEAPKPNRKYVSII